ncbi:MAG: hypothetical protein QOE70_1570 [Chthoniobacter sp.]|jgi:hypothetical protein|nr:hypothetical protein [Chthoniobacter sp.]
MHYEIFAKSEEWRWRLVADDGAAVISAPRPLTREQCMRVIEVMELTVEAPVLVVREPELQCA